MDPDSWPRLVILIVLVILSAQFTAVEAAIVKLNRYRLKNLAQELNPKAILLSRLLQTPGNLFNTILIADTFCNVGAVILGVSLVMDSWGDGWRLAVVIVVCSLLVSALGEILPRTLALRQPEKLILNLTRPIYAVVIILYPLVALLNKLNGLLAGWMGVEQFAPDNGLTEQEIISIVTASQEEGVIQQEETSMIHGVFEFTDTVAKDVMVPRPDIVAVSKDISLNELIAVIKNEQFSRLPVYEENIDNILGVVHIKDLIDAFMDDRDRFRITDYLRQPFYVPETKKVNELFKDMQKEKNHMAIVLDEYGSTAGLVTLEDLVEEIMGDIQDEHDSEEPELLSVDANTVEINGSMRLEELNEELGLELKCPEAETVGGLIFTELDRVPVEGDHIELGDIQLTVVEMDGHRIEKIRLTQLERELKEA